MIEQLKNHLEESLDFEFQGDPESETLILLGHGLTGNWQRPLLNALTEHFQSIGLSSLRWSWGGNGESQGRFEDSCLSKQVLELQAILDQLPQDRKFIYVGHSMGGAVGVLTAAKDDRIAALVSLAGITDAAGFFEREFGQLTPGQDDLWGEAGFQLSQTFADDFRQYGELLDAVEAAPIPFLLIHGTADDVVPFHDSELVLECLKDKTRLEFYAIDGGDHVFSENLETVTHRVGEWIQRQK